MNFSKRYGKWVQIAGVSLCCQFTTASFAEESEISPQLNTSQDLYLNIVLNQSTQSILGHFKQIGDDLLIDRETLQKLKFQSIISHMDDEVQFIKLNDIIGLHYVYNISEQIIEITATELLLNGNEQILGYETAKQAVIRPEQNKPGIMFNYDVYAQHNQNNITLSAWNELRLWGLSEGSIFSVSANHLYNDQDPDERVQSTILDTYWQKDFQNKAISLRIGDAQSRALDWTRSTRISGLKLSRNFELQPYQVTSPLESFKGSVLLPSSIDLLINGVKQSTSQAQPGQFNLQTVPSISGAGDAQLVITDLNGQQRIVNVSLFGTAQLLRQGLSDWDINFGVNKLNYALKSFKYDDDFVANGSYRYGLTQDTTIESHAEIAPDLQLAGLGLIHRLPKTYGIFNGSYSYSQLNDQIGQHYVLGYQWSNRTFNFSLNHQQATDDFADIATIQDYAYIQKSDQAFLGVNTNYGQFGGSYARQQYDQSENEFLIFNWSYVFPSRQYLNLSMTRDLGNQENSFYLSLNIPLDRKTNAKASIQRDRDHTQYAVNARRTAVQDQPDWGWQADANFTDQQNYMIQGQLQRQNDYGEWNVGIQNSKANGQNYTTSMASARGSVVMMDYDLFAMRQSLGSFAVVSTDGMQNVPVQLENRSVGKTNKKGLLLVKDLNAYQHNSVSIDALGLPYDYKIETTRIDAVPQNGAGVYINFPLYRIKTVQFTLLNNLGQIFPMGSRVWNQDQLPTSESKELTIVARDGLVYLENPVSSNIYIENEGQYCQLKLLDLKDQFGFIDLGNQTCE